MEHSSVKLLKKKMGMGNLKTQHLSKQRESNAKLIQAKCHRAQATKKHTAVGAVALLRDVRAGGVEGPGGHVEGEVLLVAVLIPHVLLQELRRHSRGASGLSHSRATRRFEVREGRVRGSACLQRPSPSVT